MGQGAGNSDELGQAVHWRVGKVQGKAEDPRGSGQEVQPHLSNSVAHRTQKGEAVVRKKEGAAHGGRIQRVEWIHLGALKLMIA